MRTASHVQPVSATLRRLILPLFLISGTTGLIYEVIWMRSLGTVFGNTVFAASTVLTAFMLGLALGSWLFGRLADRVRRPLRVYAWLELAIGVYAFAFPVILVLVDRFYLWFYQTYEPGFTTLTVVRFVFSTLILILPTTFMGGTLPILSGLWTIPAARKGKSGNTGQSVGLLYTVNTFGAVLGSFLAGYFLIRLLGVNASVYLAAGANVGVGVLAWLMSLALKPRPVISDAPRRKRGGPTVSKAPTAPGEEAARVYSPRTRTIVLAGILLAGFCAMALEVLWTRMLVFVLETSAYAFTCMLTCFILGIALGSLISSCVLVRRLKNPIFAFGVIEFLLALSVLGSMLVLGWLWRIDVIVIDRLVGARLSFGSDMAAHFIDTLIVVLVPTILMGMVFPLAVRICAPVWQTVGRQVGQVYACNTIGCVLGSFAAGFLLVPVLGLRDSFLAVMAAFACLAIVLIWLSGRPWRVLTAPAGVVAVGLVVGGFLLIPREVFLQTMNTYHHPSEIVFIEDGATGTVTVHDLPDGNRLIAVDGVDVAGMDLMLRTTQKLQAYAPLFVHESPQDVVQIGYGSGETCGIGLDFGVQRYTIVDICPGVFKAGRFFDEINRRSYAHPRLRKVIMDGKNFVKLSAERFDIIMNDSTNPGTTGSSALYTYDHFRACRDRLKPGGVLSCWVPLDLRYEDFQIIIRSFQAAMPHSSLWVVNNCLNKHAVLLATLEPMQLDFRRIRSIMERPEIADDLKQINVYTAYDFLDCLVVGEDDLRRLAGQGPLHTDDTPFLEFGAAIKRNAETCWLDVLTAIRDYHTSVVAYVTNAGPLPDGSEKPREILQRYARATKHTLSGAIGALIGDPDIMNAQFAVARKTNPHDRDVASILEEMDGEMRALDEAIARTPNEPELRRRLAKRHMLLQQYAPAAAHYEHFLKARPQDGAAWNNLGLCYRRIGSLDRAAEAFTRATQKAPGLMQPYMNLAETRQSQGDLPGAVRVIERVMPLLPRDRQAHAFVLLARLWALQSQHAIALQHLDKAIALAKNDPQLQQQILAQRQAMQREARGSR